MEVDILENDFTSMRNTFKPLISSYFDNKDLQKLVHEYKTFSANDVDKRLGFEQAIRDLFLEAWDKDPDDITNIQELIQLCMDAAKNEMLTPQVSVTLLSDTFDTISVTVAEQLFHFVQESLQTWKSDLFFAPCKNSILRMCNDLLRRLPKTDNVKFCGEVLLFLTLFFPFSERSGLNLVSEFNLENITHFSPEPNTNMQGDVINDIVSDALISKVDADFYKRFWTLQDFFRNPNLCYDDLRMKEFMEGTNQVLRLMSNCRIPPNPKGHKFTLSKNQMHCSKFLTGERLLIFQLNDIHFRRIMFLQYSMLFQYLKSDVKSKPESFKLDNEKLEWLKSSTISISKLAKESPFPKESPCSGPKFIKIANFILERENLWNKWKNDSCPPLKMKKPSPPREEQPIPPISSNSLADSFLKAKETQKVTTMFNGKVREWPVKMDYLAKCRNAVPPPNLKKHVDEILMEADPAAQIEDQYKKVNDMKYVWQTLKLFNQKGPPKCFNTYAQATPDKIPEYVEFLAKNISRDIATKTMQARMKKQSEEMRTRQADQTKRTKDETDAMPNNHTKEEPKEDETRHEADEDEVEMIEEVTLGDRASSDEAGSSSQESEEEDEEEEEEEEEGDEDKETKEGTDEKTDAAKADEANGKDEKEKENGDAENGDKNIERLVIPKEGLEEISREVLSAWPKLAEELGYKSDDIDFFSKEESEDYERCLNMLDVWFSNNDDTSGKHLQSALENINQSKAAAIVAKFDKKV